MLKITLFVALYVVVVHVYLLIVKFEYVQTDLHCFFIKSPSN